MRKLFLFGILLGSLYLYGEEKVYVTNTKIYHISKECRSLKRSKSVQEISKSEIGERRECKVCPKSLK
jgi:hypothetical protein